MEILIVTINTLSSLWTGNYKREGDNLVLTGLIGSFRWWMEAIVRGLGGYACDPTAPTPESCSFDFAAYRDKLGEGSITDAMEAGLQKVCPVCRILGCNGYKGSVQFDLVSQVEGHNRNGISSRQTIEIKMTTRRNLSDEEKWLLNRTFSLISEYGSIGGRMTNKPGSKNGWDYGVVSINVDNFKYKNMQPKLEQMIRNNSTRKEQSNLPNLKFFWFIERKYLDMTQMNQVLGLNESGKPRFIEDQQEAEFYQFLRGIRNENISEGTDVPNKFSKKIFSFRGNQYKRLWGYVRNENDLEKIIGLLSEFKFINENQIITGIKILKDWRCNCANR